MRNPTVSRADRFSGLATSTLRTVSLISRFYAATLGRYVQIGSDANTSPVTDHAREREPPQSSRNSQMPHFPLRLLLSRRLTKIGLWRYRSTIDSFFTLPARRGRKPLGKTSPMWEMNTNPFA